MHDVDQLLFRVALVPSMDMLRVDQVRSDVIFEHVDDSHWQTPRCAMRHDGTTALSLISALSFKEQTELGHAIFLICSGVKNLELQ